jgi:transcriptional regulator with XRE-family HTH domain
MDRFKLLAPLFGETLQEFRTAKGVSQEALALDCGRDRTFISMLERGKRQPTLETIFRLAEGLEVTPGELVVAVENKLPSSR